MLFYYKSSLSYFIGIWATAAERASNRPTTSSSSSYSRVSQPISFVSGGVKLGSKIEKKKPTTKTAETKKKPALIESYDSDEDSDEKLDDEDDDDDEIEVIGKKRKKRGDMSDDDDDSDIEEIQDEGSRPVGSVRKKENIISRKRIINLFVFRVMKKLKHLSFNVNHLMFNINDHHQHIQHQFMTSIEIFNFLFSSFNSIIFCFVENLDHLKNIPKVLVCDY